jgi:hypothetical protein
MSIIHLLIEIVAILFLVLSAGSLVLLFISFFDDEIEKYQDKFFAFMMLFITLFMILGYIDTTFFSHVDKDIVKIRESQEKVYNQIASRANNNSNSLFEINITNENRIVHQIREVEIHNNNSIGRITCFTGIDMANRHLSLSVDFCGITSQNENMHVIDICNGRTVPYHGNITHNCSIVIIVRE